MEKGKKNWVFCDGDLPPAGNDPAFSGHEALMITNVGEKDSKIELVVLFEDAEPKRGICISLKAMRTICLRMDKPLGEEGYRIPTGQYALWVKSDVPVCACFGRLDVRQPNMAYYSQSGCSF